MADPRRRPAAARPRRGAAVAFTTRQGGVSGGGFASLNLGFATPDDAAAVAENRRRALVAAGADPALALSLRQVHGKVVLEAAPAPAGAYLDAGHGLGRGGCARDLGAGAAAGGARRRLPHRRARGRRRRAVATVHAGWRGLVAGVVEAAADRVGSGFSAVIGPGAGACCYEVGEDVAAPLRERFGDAAVTAGRADLAACAERALERSGAGVVVNSRLCTICEPEWFHSHRRDGRDSGRQAVIAYIEEERA